jgi:outer membrane protein assembly factor BamB
MVGPHRMVYVLRSVLPGSLLVLAVLAHGEVLSGEWPMYQHDAARSGITAEELRTPLVPCWVFQARQAPQPAWGDPKSRPVEGILELPRNHFDDAFQVAVAGGSVYFGSSAENKVFALEAKSGRVRWTRITGGPIRLAPAVAGGRVYVGSDDGYAYCLDARDGSIVWQFRAAPQDRRVLGNGRMISLWPVRSGVLLDGGVAYLAAGIFPTEGVFLYALDAGTGAVRWRNDSGGKDPRSQISPQGYLLASETTLYAPLGRASPAAFDRRSGKFKYQTNFGKEFGGTYAQLSGDDLYLGTEVLLGCCGEPKVCFTVLPARKLVITPGTVYLAADEEILATDAVAYPPLGNKLYAARCRIQDLEEQRDTAAAAGKRQPNLERKLRSLAEQMDQLRKEAATAVRWHVASRCHEALVLAGGTLLAGGQREVVALDAASGRKLWTSPVEGTVRGLAVADGRVLASTDRGMIYCFAAEGPPPGGIITEPGSDPYRQSPAAPLCRKAAETILAETGIRRGYCLVLGCETGQLAFELARQSELKIYAVSPDKKQVAAARRALDTAGVYGSRVCVDCYPLDHVPYSDDFANLIVSESALAGGELPDALQAARMLRPLGGVALIGRPEAPADGDRAAGPDAQALQRWLQATGLPGGQVIANGGQWAKIVRGPIPGAGSWTHLYGNAGNTGCGDDTALRCPLDVLWFGEPGPANMVPRHERAAAPLSIDGRLFVQGENLVAAYDAYNGLPLWERSIPGALRCGASALGSNLALDHQSLFVAVGPQCLRLDPATGHTLATYSLPPRTVDAEAEKERPAAPRPPFAGAALPPSAGYPRSGGGLPPSSQDPLWGYVACDGNLLFGSRADKRMRADAVFAIDLRSGRPAWVYEGKEIAYNSIAVADGRLFLLDLNLTAAQRAAGRDPQQQPHAVVLDGKPLKPPTADVRLAVALDAASGRRLWALPLDVTYCGGNVAGMAARGVLLWFGVYTDGHYWEQFYHGQLASRRITALSAADGKLLWSKPLGYRVRPLVIGDTLHAEPWAFDLKTGEPKMRINPATGETERWQWIRPGHHCGPPIASPNSLFFRSWSLGYYDLLADTGPTHFAGQRPGCWINFIPAGGLLLMPEASAGCMCAFPNMCTVVFRPAAASQTGPPQAAR